MDLIDRAAVEKALWDYDTWYSGSVDPLHSVYRWKSFLEKVPTVPAASLDALCEWLEENAGLPTNDYMISKTAWKRKLKQWMEEQHEKEKQKE